MIVRWRRLGKVGRRIRYNRVMKAQNKTVANNASIIDFLASLDDDQQRRDSESLIEIMQDITGEPPVMWGTAIIGFGNVHVTSPSGREVDWLRIGFSPRKGKLSLYVTFDAQKYQTELDKMGKHKIGKGCIYINRLSDVDTSKLTSIIKTAYDKGYGA
jgi:hypothetical protein